MSDRSLVADIGGTNTRVALATGTQVDAGSVRRYANADHSGIAEVIRTYLSDSGTDRDSITGVCVAAAGPVHDGVATLTNLNWRVDREVLGEALTAERVAVLNDLQAQGHAVGYLAADKLIEVLPNPEAGAHAAKLVVGVGTGFNAAPVYDTAAGRFVPPSECGHVTLPDIGGAHSAKVIAALRAEHEVASVEEALSGRGIGQVHAALHGEKIPAAKIMSALEAGDPKAEATVALAIRYLGTVLGDLALIHLPFGGIFLIGGVARSLGPYFDRFGLAEAMHDKGRFRSFVEQFGVSIVTDDYAALTGCASHLSHQL
ncbi:ROK family protein [Rhodobacterales bacterium HKCCE3408]|nr:ROK family protein [Rhodobacterales bacterium HKCCE3408]